MRTLVTEFLEALHEAVAVFVEKTTDLDIWAWSSSIPTNGTFYSQTRKCTIYSSWSLMNGLFSMYGGVEGTQRRFGPLDGKIFGAQTSPVVLRSSFGGLL